MAYIDYEVSVEILYISILNFNGAAIEVWECLSNFISLFTGYAIISMLGLTHWLLEDVAAILKVLFSNSLYRIIAWLFSVKVLSDECHIN